MITKEQALGLYCNCDKLTLYDTTSLQNIIDEKLILRTYEDMTEEEVDEFTKVDGLYWGKAPYEYRIEKIKEYKHSEEEFEYLISIGIDVFNLISRGWAERKRK